MMVPNLFCTSLVTWHQNTYFSHSITKFTDATCGSEVPIIMLKPLLVFFGKQLELLPCGCMPSPTSWVAVSIHVGPDSYNIRSEQRQSETIIQASHLTLSVATLFTQTTRPLMLEVKPICWCNGYRTSYKSGLYIHLGGNLSRIQNAKNSEWPSSLTDGRFYGLNLKRFAMVMGTPTETH